MCLPKPLLYSLIALIGKKIIPKYQQHGSVNDVPGRGRRKKTSIEENHEIIKRRDRQSFACVRETTSNL